MKIGNKSKSFAIGLGVTLFAVYSATCGTIYQSGGSGTTYTDALGDQQGSANLLRDLSSVTVANDANNLFFTINVNPGANLFTGGSFNYVIGITPGNPSAGGDTSASSDHGNPYGRSISFDSSFGGMTDWIGVFGAGGAGSTSSPFTSYGFNDYVYSAGTWTKIDTVASGEPVTMQPSTSTPNSISLTVPLSDFASNLTLTPGTTFDFDVMSTGTSGNQTAYDSLVDQTPIQSGTYSSTYQYNETVLDQYTISSVPEPGILALAGLSGLSLILFRRQQK